MINCKMTKCLYNESGGCLHSECEVGADGACLRALIVSDIHVALIKSVFSRKKDDENNSCSAKKNITRADVSDEQLYDMYIANGMTAEQIAQELGIGRSTCYRWLAQSGVSRLEQRR